MEYKRLTDDELADFLQRACVQLVPELTQQLLSLGMELAEYRTKIEQGTLIELPCKVGDTVWTINCWKGYGKKELGERYIVTRYELHENVCGRIEIHEENYRQGKVVIIPKEKYMGVTPWVFITREEAEKRLKELQNE